MEFTTESGAQVVINRPLFTDISRLRVAVLGAVKESGVEISKIDIDKLLSGVKEDMGAAVKSGALDSLLGMVITLDCSEKVNNEIFNCLKRSTYNSEKITRDTFNSEDAMGDYYHIVIMCLKVNLAPFFKTLFSKLSALQLMKKQESQK